VSELVSGVSYYQASELASKFGESRDT
jgi:hypothetical protein